MKDNIEFLIEFIQEVKVNPQLYNYTVDDYCNKKVTDVIWTKIGAKFNESSEDCKTKWKSIRSAYIRSLNTKTKSGAAAGSKKKYYLSTHLQFLNPFIKCRTQEGNIPVKQEDTEHESQVQTRNSEIWIEEPLDTVSVVMSADEDSLKHEDSAAGSPSSNPNSPSPSMPTSCRKRQVCEEDKCAIKYFSLKKKRLEKQPETRHHDPSEMFLLSLNPHIASMSQQQQLRFQRGVLELIENIKYGQSRSTSSDYLME